jgi:hypothetical protein
MEKLHAKYLMLLLVSYYYFLLGGDGMRDLFDFGKLVKIIKFLAEFEI